jgi:hypothetical protein
MNFKTMLPGFILFILSISGQAAPNRVQLMVWANEAIVATYTYNYDTYLQDQKQIAQYFTADGWIAYSKALNDSKLPDAVQKNTYKVSAVATKPPQLIIMDPTHWTVIMPILVNYKNPKYEQQQNLKIVLWFSEAPSGQGVRGLNVTSLQSTEIEPPCLCADTEIKALPAPTTKNEKKS